MVGVKGIVVLFLLFIIGRMWDKVGGIWICEDMGSGYWQLVIEWVGLYR